jgi:TolA-binding protein
MQMRISPIIAVCCLVFLHSVAADTITLTSGKKIEGRIIRVDGDYYVVEVEVSGTIRDEKKIARADVKFIDEKGADEKGFDEIGVLVPTPDLLEKEAYVEWISKLKDFLKTYPKSPKAQDVKGMLDILSSEYAIVAAGGIKFGDEMVSADDYEANAYEYAVKIAEKKIKNAVTRRDFLSALRIFSEYSEKFGESEGSGAMSALMLQVLGAYKASLNENLGALDSRMEKRQSGLASMTPEDRLKTERALKEQMERIEKRFQKERAAAQKWVTPDSFHKESMDEALRAVDSEISRLRSLPEHQPLEIPLAEVYRVAWGKLADVIEKESKRPDGTEEGSELSSDTEEEKRLATNSEEEKKKVIEEARVNRLTEFYLEKLRIRAGFGSN